MSHTGVAPKHVLEHCSRTLTGLSSRRRLTCDLKQNWKELHQINLSRESHSESLVWAGSQKAGPGWKWQGQKAPQERCLMQAHAASSPGGFAGLHVALSPLKAHTSCLCMGESWQIHCPYQQIGRFKNLGLGTCWLPWSEWISIPLTVHDFQDIWKYFKGFQRTGCVWVRGRPEGYEY